MSQRPRNKSTVDFSGRLFKALVAFLYCKALLI